MDSALTNSLTDESESTGPAPAGDWISGIGNSPNAPPISATAPPEAPDVGASPSISPTSNLANAVQPAQPDLPRFRRTFGNTLKGIAVGFGLAGLPGAVAGGISPQGIQKEANSRAAMEAANQHFASARAAHEALQAALLEKQVNTFDEQHHAEMEKIGLDNLKAAQEAGFKIVGVTPLDGEPADNAKAAMNNLQQIQKNNGGTVPEGLLHIHGGNGNGIFTLQLQDPAAALGVINQTRRAQGLPELDSNTFMGLSPQDRQAQAKDAINFTMPTDPKTGQISQESATTLENRLALVKAQPDFTGKDALVANLQRSLDFQTSALEHEAARKGKATGAEAMAAQPGQTEAKRAEIGTLAGPEAQAAGQKAGAEEAAKFPYELKLKQAEKEQDQGFAMNPKTGQRELVAKADAKEQGMTNWVKAGQTDIEKETNLNAQLNELQLNTSRYKTALNAMTPLSKMDVFNMTRVLTDKSINSFLTNELTLGAAMDQLSQGEKASAWNALSPDKQAALMGALRMKNSALLFQKVATGMGRASKEAMDIEIANMPSPIEGATVGNQKLQAFQENVDQMASRAVKLPWQETSQEVKARVEGEAVKQFNQRESEKKQNTSKASASSVIHKHGVPIPVE